MEQVVIIRYGEIFLKGDNRAYFENLLLKNIRNTLSPVPCKLERIQGRLILTGCAEEDRPEILRRLQRVFGIHSISEGVRFPSDLERMKEISPDFVYGKTFRFTVNRADKRFPKPSMEVARELGGAVLAQRPDLKVDLHHPDCTVFLDIREDGNTYLYSRTLDCQRGMPYGCSGKGLLLLSGGIDSPVAGFSMARRGMKVEAVHFHSFPYTSVQAREKVLELGRILKDYCGGEMKVYVVSFTQIQQAIHKHCRDSFMITIMRRFMMRIANRLARECGAQAILTGESLGQVASQTPESIASTDSVSELPVFRPLIAEDKQDIVAVAKRIGTFETSILPYEDCCTVFLPKNPVIHPKLHQVEQEEAKLDVEALTAQALASLEVETL